MIFPEDACKAEPRITIDQAHSRLSVDETLLRRVVEYVLEGERRNPDLLGIVLIERAAMQALNKRWRDSDYDTDVLSFPLGPEKAIGGEIFVNLDFAYDHCTEFGATFIQEVCRYVAHGVLHLIGYDDATDAGRHQMQRLEDRYLAGAGIIKAAAAAP